MAKNQYPTFPVVVQGKPDDLNQKLTYRIKSRRKLGEVQSGGFWSTSSYDVAIRQARKLHREGRLDIVIVQSWEAGVNV